MTAAQRFRRVLARVDAARLKATRRAGSVIRSSSLMRGRGRARACYYPGCQNPPTHRIRYSCRGDTILARARTAGCCTRHATRHAARRPAKRHAVA